MKSLLPGREHVPAIITLIIVLFLGAGYYFIYLPGNESTFHKWKFRTLSNIDKNIHSKIENGTTALGNYLQPDSLLCLLNRARKIPTNNQLIFFSNSIHQINKRIKRLKSEDFPIDSISVLRPGYYSEPIVLVNGNKSLWTTSP